MELKERQRHDLSLLLLGVSLAKGTDKEMMKTFPPEHLPKELGDVLAAIQSKDVNVVRKFMESLGAPLDTLGAIQAAASALNSHSSAARIRQMIGTIAMGSKILPTHDLVAKLRQCADELETNNHQTELSNE